MRPAAALALAVVVASVLAGCTRRQDRPQPLQPAPALSSTTASRPPLPTRSPLTPPSRTASVQPSASGFSETYVVACNGRPTGEQVIAVVKRRSLIPTNASVTVKTGPMCAGTWQYTVLTMTGSEPLQVVTRGAPQALAFVTAGTSVCTAEVRSSAPEPLRRLANC